MAVVELLLATESDSDTFAVEGFLVLVRRVASGPMQEHS
jgi:hypothetical protein